MTIIEKNLKEEGFTMVPTQAQIFEAMLTWHHHEGCGVEGVHGTEIVWWGRLLTTWELGDREGGRERQRDRDIQERERETERQNRKGPRDKTIPLKVLPQRPTLPNQTQPAMEQVSNT